MMDVAFLCVETQISVGASLLENSSNVMCKTPGYVYSDSLMCIAVHREIQKHGLISQNPVSAEK